ncbi:MAG: primosomal protein N', partial [Treponema sp.]|nr:primosomal protein N' [Treponema sp.]
VYGKTGSGKTEVFLQAAEHLLKIGKGVIYLVPEISLTQQVIEAVISRFGNTVAVLHSGLTPSQKLSEWHRILNREARVVIGARSAVFAPVPDLGMIIIDEEHDASYKSGTTPRYHGRQVAMYRTSRLSIPLVMGSATPSVEAWHLMQTKALHCHTLTKRLSGGAMPRIEPIDLSKQQISGCISPKLNDEIKAVIAKKHQVILFLNRRGFTHFFRCNTCGYELMCKNCSVPLTYHKNENRLRCHYCGWVAEVPHECPRCGSLDVGYSGFGTEFIEAEVKVKFPEARIVRIDTDSLTKKGELQEKLEAFRKGDYDIMLGTQMVAKGLNFPKLELVGIILADTGLHMPDFRASERTFALITQVAGRAGRFFPDGKVLVQTYNPDRSPIYNAIKGNDTAFYKEELEIRKLLDFPPYSRLIRLVFRSPSKTVSNNSAMEAAVILKKLIEKLPKNRDGTEQAELLGPSECPIEKIAMNHRYQIILKGKNIQSLQKLASHLIYDYKKPQEVYIETDVDPVSLL